MSQQEIFGNNNLAVLGDYTEIKVENLPKLPSSLARVVTKLAESLPPPTPYRPPLAFEIEAKIRHNDIKAHRRLIETGAVHEPTIGRLYDTLDDTIPNAKSRSLAFFVDLYAKCLAKIIQGDVTRGTFTSESDCIRQNADRILSQCITALQTHLQGSPSVGIEEDISVCASLLVCHAFINCYILERPPM